MDKLVLHIEKEWDNIKKAPIAYLLTAILVGGLIFVVLDRENEKINDSLHEQIGLLNERIESLNERIQSKDDLIVEYRERLRLASILGSSNSHLTNNELRKKTLQFVANIREFLASNNVDFEINAQINKNFKDDAILLRDELLSRLPKDFKNEKVYDIYESATNSLGMQVIADDLEHLAKGLKK